MSLVLTTYIDFRADKLPDFIAVMLEDVLIEGASVFKGRIIAEGIGPPADWVLGCAKGFWAEVTTQLPATLVYPYGQWIGT